MEEDSSRTGAIESFRNWPPFYNWGAKGPRFLTKIHTANAAVEATPHAHKSQERRRFPQFLSYPCRCSSRERQHPNPPNLIAPRPNFGHFSFNFWSRNPECAEFTSPRHQIRDFFFFSLRVRVFRARRRDLGVRRPCRCRRFPCTPAHHRAPSTRRSSIRAPAARRRPAPPRRRPPLTARPPPRAGCPASSPPRPRRPRRLVPAARRARRAVAR